MPPEFSRLRITILTILFLQVLCGFAQVQIISPYSRFGLGDLSDNNNAWNMSMGQLGIGIQSPIHINYTNPASYAAFDSLSFVFEGGFNGEFINLTSNVQSVSRSNASLGYLLFGMPVTRWWKTSLGLVPYSEVGYNVANYEEYIDAGTVKRVYSGSGGISRLFWGNAFRIVKGLSLGVNASYLFGSMDRGSTVTFPESLNMMNIRVSNYITMNDLSFTFGAQYRSKIGEELYLTVGGIFTPTLAMSSKANVIATTFLMNSNGTESVRDTLLMAENYRGDIVIPWQAGGGISLQKNNKWLFGIDYKYQNWQDFSVFDVKDSLSDSWQLSAGAEVTPNSENYGNYLARMQYRLGFIYNRTYLTLRGQQLDEYALAVGFGLPLRGTRTMVNLGFQFGTRGTTEQNLIQEGYMKLVVGFSLHERWFVKRRYF